MRERDVEGTPSRLAGDVGAPSTEVPEFKNILELYKDDHSGLSERDALVLIVEAARVDGLPPMYQRMGATP